MLKTKEEELTQKAVKTEKSLLHFMNQKNILKISIKGMLNPSFEITEKEKRQNIHIQHNEKPAAGIYPWVLVILGGLIVLGAIAQMLEKNKPA